ncbi:MAG TPA: enoyl-CoA hydratase-related protein [Virgibacillus sp.]|nr:enoyl-CoA hydratase-related protein [Virgibacillus sp.]
MTYEYSLLTYEDNIAIIKINTPPANILSSRCIQELRKVIKRLNEEDSTHAIIITGAGRFFVAGADIKEFVPALGHQDKALQMAEAGQALCNEIEAMDKPVIAAINGPALGGGLELALGCHYRIAADDAILGLPELNLGLIPTFGGTQRLSRLTNIGTAIDIILTDKQLNGEEAKQLGIIHQSVSQELLMETAMKTAKSFVTGKSMTSVQRAMKAITKGYEESLDSGLKRERELFAELFLTNDAEEGVKAFVDKRTPNFKHT